MGLGRNYRTLWTAAAISNLGDGVALTAMPLLAASLTRDPLLISGVVIPLVSLVSITRTVPDLRALRARQAGQGARSGPLP